MGAKLEPVTWGHAMLCAGGSVKDEQLLLKSFL
jgi:hypothetical protein